MNYFFDIDYIQNNCNFIEDEEDETFKQLFEDYEKDQTFQNKLSLAWNVVSSKYAKKLQPVFDLNDESLKNQLSTEILLQLFNTLSTHTSEWLEGVDVFLNNSHFSDKKKHFTYSDKGSFNKFADNLRSCQPERLRTTIISASEELSSCQSEKSESGTTAPVFPKSEPFLTINPITRSKLILEQTPLYNFIFSHLTYKDDFYENQIPLTKSGKENNKINYAFLKEGRYFLSVLLFSSSSKEIPYTSKTLYGISLNSINKLFNTLYEAYHQKELINNPEESFLFFINTECLFQPSLLCKIFTTLSDFFYKFKADATPAFISSLFFIPNLTECRLNVAKIHLWDYLYEKNSKIFLENFRPYYPLIGEILNTIEEMTNCFINILLQLTVFSSNNTDFSNLHILKKEIFNYLLKTKKSDMEWSILNSSSKNYTKISSIFNKYFDFYTLFQFYNSSIDSAWNQTDNIYAYEWPGYNHFAKYCLDHMK